MVTREQRKNRGLRGTEGVSAVEFGLVLPLLLMILLGIIDYGWVFFVRLNMTNAAREGARVGATRDAADRLTDATKATCSYLSYAGLGCAYDSAGGTCSCPAGWSYTSMTVTPATLVDNGIDVVRVTVDVNGFSSLTGFVPVPSQMTVRSQMRWELEPVAEASP